MPVALLMLLGAFVPHGPECAFAYDGRRVVGLDGGALLVWDAGNGRLRRRIAGNRPYTHVAISPDGRQAVPFGQQVNADTGATYGSLGPQLWNLASGRQAALAPLAARMAVFAPDGRLLLCGAGVPASMWDPRTGRLVRLPPADEHTTVAFSRDGGRAMLGGVVADTHTGAVVGRFLPTARLSPDGAAESGRHRGAVAR